MRYTLPMIVYLAVLGTAWIAQLRRVPRTLLTAALAVAVLATTVGMTFGVGVAPPPRLPGNLGAVLGVGVPPRGRIVVYANHDYILSGPRRDGDMLRLLRDLHGIGVRHVYWDPAAAGPEHSDFNGAGLTVLARVAKLSLPKVIASEEVLPRSALLVYQPAPPDAAPCVRFGDGMGVWALIGRRAGAVPYCPGRGALGPPVPVPRIDQAQGATNLP
jgi:hypothetical protein